MDLAQTSNGSAFAEVYLSWKMWGICFTCEIVINGTEW